MTLGAESLYIIRALDLLGLSDVAEGGLNYWLFGEHAPPFIWLGEVMENDALTCRYSGPNQVALGYDRKHSGGHGQIMNTAAFHYRITNNKRWLAEARPALEKACQATIRVRKEWMKKMPESTWAYGLVPPGITGDVGDIRTTYYLSAVWYSGLKEIASVLAQEGSEMGGELVKEADLALQDLRKATERSLALSPVVKVRDGTYRRHITWQSYIRGLGAQLPCSQSGWWGSWYYEMLIGGLRLVPGVYDRNEPIVQEMLDVYEDVILSTEAANPSSKDREPRDGEAWFTRSGFGPQNALEDHQRVHLLTDGVPSYIRAVFNGYAAELSLDNGYTFWEMPYQGGAPDKTVEEAGFLERLRMMLVMEDGDTLWLARATPRAWFEQGKKILVKNAPSYFGILAYEILSDVDNGKISATVEMPSRKPNSAVMLRFRHPKTAPIRSVMVNGKPWPKFMPEKDAIDLTGLNGKVAVVATY